MTTHAGAAATSSGPTPPATVAPLLKDFGFVASPDLPDRPGPAYLLVALRDHPTLRHYDPEAVDYWGEPGRARPPSDADPHRDPAAPDGLRVGLIRIVDRLQVTNEYLTFGGRLSVDAVDGVVVASFTSPAPLLRRGGHSQGWDEGAETLGAFFSRFLLAVDVTPGFEARASLASPITRYAAFVADTMARYRSSPMMRLEQPRLWTLLRSAERRLRAEHPTEWADGEPLRSATAV